MDIYCIPSHNIILYISKSKVSCGNISVIIHRSDVAGCNKNREQKSQSSFSVCTASAASVVVTVLTITVIQTLFFVPREEEAMVNTEAKVV